jgi:hypothetical protein
VGTYLGRTNGGPIAIDLSQTEPHLVKALGRRSEEKVEFRLGQPGTDPDVEAARLDIEAAENHAREAGVTESGGDADRQDLCGYCRVAHHRLVEPPGQ